MRLLVQQIQREKLAAARLAEDKATARDVRGKFVEELWGLAREFRIREQEQVKADQLSKKLTRLEGVETELRDAERYTTGSERASLLCHVAVGPVRTSVPFIAWSLWWDGFRFAGGDSGGVTWKSFGGGALLI